MSHDLVSVIVPVYNAEKYLHKCIESILNQTYTAIELILVNDGSKDNTLNICQDFSSRDPRILVIDQENKGVSEARNAGISAASGKYILLVDSDDWLDHEAIMHMVNAAISTRAELVKIGIKHIHMTRSVIVKPDETICLDCARIVEWYQEYRPLLSSAGGSLYMTDILKDRIRFKASMSYSEDTLFNLEYLPHCRAVCILSHVGYFYYCINEQSAIHKFHPNMDEYMLLLTDKTFHLLSHGNLTQESTQQLSYFLRAYFMSAMIHYVRYYKDKQELRLKAHAVYQKFNDYREERQLSWLQLSPSDTNFRLLQDGCIDKLVLTLRRRERIATIKRKLIKALYKISPSPLSALTKLLKR